MLDPNNFKELKNKSSYGLILKVIAKSEKSPVYGRFIITGSVNSFIKIDDFEKFKEDLSLATTSEITINELESAELVRITQDEDEWLKNHMSQAQTT